MTGYDNYYDRYGYLGYAVNASRELTDSSPPQVFTEPMEVLEMATYLKLPVSMIAESEESGELSSMITAARVAAEVEQNRDLVRKQIDMTLDYWPPCPLQLATPLISVDLVRYQDSDGNLTTLAENIDYKVFKDKRPGFITPLFNQTWPIFTPQPSSSLLVRFTCGYAADSIFWSDTGSIVKQGMKNLISDWWNNGIPVGVVNPGILFSLRVGAVPRVR